MKIKKYIVGHENERMPGFAFNIMAFCFKIRDLIKPGDKYIKSLGIKEGDTVIDYGCGIGSHAVITAKITGNNGKVYAVDIHPSAIKSINKLINKHNIKNIKPVLADGYNCNINDKADIIYALDMFHMIENPASFLKELKRLLKKDGCIILEDGHQPREETIKKIKESNQLQILEETEKYVKLKLI